VGARLYFVALALATAGCGQATASAPPDGPAAVTVLVTRDFGTTSLKSQRAAPEQSAMNALRRSAEVGTAYGGRFVTTIDGLEGSKSQEHDWLYYVNGIDPGVGAADMKLHPGDHEWWDYRYWRDFMGIPAVIGAWPEPFVHGFEGRRPAVAVQGPSCAGSLRDMLRKEGARIAEKGPYTVKVSTFAQDADALADWQGGGLTVRVTDGRVEVYHGGDGWRPAADAAAVVVARSPEGIPGRSFELLIAGRDEAAACAGAKALTETPAEIAHTYAVALDADGRVVAAGGQR
jgi:hypothetical protein